MSDDELDAIQIEALVLEVLGIEARGLARERRRQACAATQPSLPANRGIDVSPSQLPPPSLSQAPANDSGRYSYVAPRCAPRSATHRR